MKVPALSRCVSSTNSSTSAGCRTLRTFFARIGTPNLAYDAPSRRSRLKNSQKRGISTGAQSSYQEPEKSGFPARSQLIPVAPRRPE
jgi:hypothetical protein